MTQVPGEVVDLDLLADPVRLRAVERVLAPAASSDEPDVLDRLAALAALLLRAPAAQVSLVGTRQVLAGVAGVDRPEEPTDPAESLCTVTLGLGGPLAVSDARTDERVRHLPPVAEGAVGSYLGVPLYDRAGRRLGALCVHDAEPRTWTSEQVGVLDELAAGVVAELERRAITAEAVSSAARLDLALEAADVGSFQWHLGTDRLTCDDRLLSLLGADPATFVPHADSLRSRLLAEDVAVLARAVDEALATGVFTADVRLLGAHGQVRGVEARGRVLAAADGSPHLLGVAYDVTTRQAAQREREAASREREQAVVERERAYAQAEAANTRLSLLADATTRLSASLEPEQVLEELSSIVVPALGSWLAVAVPSDEVAPLLGVPDSGEPGRLDVVHVRAGDPARGAEIGGLLRSLDLSVRDRHGFGAVLRTGRPEWLDVVPDQLLQDATADPGTLARLRALGLGSLLTVPLVSRGRTLGALAVAEPVAGPVDRALLGDLAGRAAVALDNALLYRVERRTGITLQRSLLPQAVPRLPGLETAARYLPGTTGAFVGGDWYQGVQVDGRMLLAMGDVMGHGMRSAARMGQLRAIVATLALEGHGPGALLERLAANVDQLLDLELATLLVALYDPADRGLRVATAGHPPPVLAAPGEEPVFLDVVPGPPLGTLPGTYEETAVVVPPGSSLALYTDGLVEDRSATLSDGLERLRLALQDVSSPPDHVADHVLRRLGRAGGADDDVALLVVRTAP